MTKLKQGLVTIGGAILLSFIFIKPAIGLYIGIFGRGSSGSVLDVTVGGDSLSWSAFFYAFPFFLTLLEFFFKKPILDRRPYLYIIGFFVLISFVDEKFLLATVAVVLLGALPGTLFNWRRSKNQAKVIKP